MDKEKRKNSAPLAFLAFPQFYQFKTALSLEECKTRLSEEIPIKRLYTFSGKMKIIPVMEAIDDTYCEFISFMGATKVPFFVGEGSLTGHNDGTAVVLKVMVDPYIYITLLMVALFTPVVAVTVGSTFEISWIGVAVIIYTFLAVTLALGLYVRLKYRHRFAEFLAKHLGFDLESTSNQKPVFRT